jgi:hypothetical protein
MLSNYDIFNKTSSFKSISKHGQGSSFRWVFCFKIKIGSTLGWGFQMLAIFLLFFIIFKFGWFIVNPIIVNSSNYNSNRL